MTQHVLETMDYVSHNEKFMNLIASRAKTDPSYKELLDELLIIERMHES